MGNKGGLPLLNGGESADEALFPIANGAAPNDLRNEVTNDAGWTNVFFAEQAVGLGAGV